MVGVFVGDDNSGQILRRPPNGRQPLANLKDAGTLYGAIIYQKAPIVMRQLEQIVGADGFRDGLRDYLRRYSYGNASWPELIAILDARTPDDLARWSQAWVDERGRPVVTTDLTIDGGRIASLAFTTRDPYPARGVDAYLMGETFLPASPDL